MYMPSIFGESLFDDMFPFDDSFFTSKKNPLYGKNASRVMKTDIKENEGSYELDIDLPGFKKDEITAELKDGYLTVSAAKGLDKDEEDKKGHYIRQERYSGAMSRTFYVGEDVKQEDIKAKFEKWYRLACPFRNRLSRRRLKLLSVLRSKVKEAWQTVKTACGVWYQ